ncbi:MAG: hypothetical protein LBN43_08060 [Oscillospiraceae bacterium]|nr:hypothetical protein [Oscillospiraceae bacterium]
MSILLIVAAAHAAICVLWILFGIRELKAGNSFTLVVLPLVALVPLFGALCAFISLSENKRPLEIPDDDLSVFNESEADVLASGVQSGNPVPIEEALEVNDSRARHDLMMQIIRHDPGSQIDVLRMVRLGTDSEAAHYATTAIMEIQRQFDISIQEIEADLRNEPDNAELLDKYIETLHNYIKSGLLQGGALERQRKSFDEALEKKLTLAPNSKSSYIMAAENALALEKYSYSAALARKLRELWPHDEVGWIKALDVIMASGDAAGKREFESELQNSEVRWSRDGRQYIDFIFIGGIAE